MARLKDRIVPALRAAIPRSRSAVLFVDGGTVACPVQGDVDLEVCLACAKLTAVDGQAPTRIECRPGEHALRSAMGQTPA